MNDKTIGVKNTSLASFLVAKDHKVVGIDRDGSSTLFLFTNSPSLADDVQALKFGDDLVSARRLFEARSYLLTLIHDDGGFAR